MIENTEFTAIFDSLKTILQNLEPELKVKHDEPGKYYLLSKKLDDKNKEIWFGGVEIKKNYVSFHFVPLYYFPELLNEISPELKKRLTGKSCFNFKKTDAAIFSQLETLTKKAFEIFTQK